ncbi:MAG TPA: 3-oxoacyl-ACP reductase [Candidatus Eremiobacteraceae bacterium]|nr:3-oxoacyl-ACP reductase [Candidatus Eremiobacteraceae bacterium]
MNNSSLDGRVAIVTGGARGIGAAIARALAADGARIAITGLNGDAAGGKRLSAELGADRCRFYESDVSDADGCAQLIASVLRDFDHIDILINNAGITRDHTVRKLSVQDWLDVIKTNLNGPFFMIKAVLDHMIERGYGRIVSMSSVIAHTGNVGQANYAASKAGLLGLTKSVALETASRGITANCVAPGFIDTEMVAAMPAAAKEASLAHVPEHRLGKPEEIARVVRFLVDDNAGFITGTVVNANGGLYM